MLGEVMTKAPTIAQVVEAIFGIDLDAFVRLALPSALPSIVLRVAQSEQLGKTGLIDDLAKRAGISVPEMLMTHLASILAPLLIEADGNNISAVTRYVERRCAATMKDLMPVCVRILSVKLVLTMGKAEEKDRAKGKVSLGAMTSLAGRRRQPDEIAEFVYEQFLFIIFQLRARITSSTCTFSRLSFFLVF